MPAPRTQPLWVYERIYEVMRRRAETPSDKELAKELGCSVHFIQHTMGRRRIEEKLAVSRETLGDLCA